MQLPAQVRWKLARQSILAALKIADNVPVALVETAEGLAVKVDGRLVSIPSPLRWKLYRRGWEARLDRLEREYGVGRHVALGPQSVVVDVGANVGEFAYVAARYGSRIFCVEPDPHAFACLKRNIAPLAGASAHELAIWKQDGDIEFALASARADSSVFAESETRVKRRALTLAAFARQKGIERVDLLKCDAEGAEPEVLEGVADFFPNVAAVALDTGPERHGERTHEACAKILKARGLRVIAETVGTRQMTFGLRG